MRTDGIQEQISEPEPERAPERTFDGSGRFPLPSYGEPVSDENMLHVACTLNRVLEALDSWDPHHPSYESKTIELASHLRKGHVILMYIEECLSNYMYENKEDGT